jgi:TfoX/Sxy family transcriptional regulator of competence genes
MAFDEQLTERVRERLGGVDGVVELKMFGGWGVTIRGNMAVGVMENDLIVRVGPDAFADALTRSGARPFDFTGRSMTGWVYVAATSVKHGRALDAWVRRGVEYAQSLPAKSATKKSARRPRTAR